MSGAIQQGISWVGAHPHLAGVIVALIAFSESLAFVGLLVPGAALMLGAGALIANGVMGFWPTLAWAVLGALAGDGLSYALGHHYRGRIRALWPFRTHPDLLRRGEAFFRRHGAKSVFLGRFVGPVRPLIPVVAGMLGMGPGAFYLANLLSALAWAPAYLLPGMAFGTALAAAGAITTRLAVPMALLGVAIWLIFRLTRLIHAWFQAHAQDWTERIVHWGRSHPPLDQVIDAVVEPDRPASPALLLMAAALVASTWLFLGILEDVATRDPLVVADQGIYQLLQGLRNPWGDRLMVAWTELGDAAVTLPLTLLVLAWLLWRKERVAAYYWLAANAFGTVAVTLIKVLLTVPRPVALYSGSSSYSFPSGHATMSMLIYGFLAMLCGRGLAERWRWLPYALAAMMIAGIGFSRLYLGAHWFSDVAGGYSLGLAWIILLAIAYQRHQRPHRITGLAAVVLLTLAVAGGWHVQHRFATDLQRYAPRHPITTLDAARWWARGWRGPPARRTDLEGEHEQPLNVQYAGPLDTLEGLLKAQGWRRPPPLSPMTALRWLLPRPCPMEAPILPQVQGGHLEAMLMIRPNPEQADCLQTLRLWPGDARLSTGQSLWLGSITCIRMRRYLGWVSLPRTAAVLPPAQTLHPGSLQALEWKTEVRGPGAGKVLLLAYPP
jgi:undecaprenyl-diphosphatase